MVLWCNVQRLRIDKTGAHRVTSYPSWGPPCISAFIERVKGLLKRFLEVNSVNGLPLTLVFAAEGWRDQPFLGTAIELRSGDRWIVWSIPVHMLFHWSREGQFLHGDLFIGKGCAWNALAHHLQCLKAFHVVLLVRVLLFIFDGGLVFNFTGWVGKRSLRNWGPSSCELRRNGIDRISSGCLVSYSYTWGNQCNGTLILWGNRSFLVGTDWIGVFSILLPQLALQLYSFKEWNALGFWRLDCLWLVKLTIVYADIRAYNACVIGHVLCLAQSILRTSAWSYKTISLVEHTLRSRYVLLVGVVIGRLRHHILVDLSDMLVEGPGCRSFPLGEKPLYISNALIEIYSDTADCLFNVFV